MKKLKFLVEDYFMVLNERPMLIIFMYYVAFGLSYNTHFFEIYLRVTNRNDLSCSS